MGCVEQMRARDGWRGEHRDVLLGPDGEVVWERDWGQNTLVDTARVVIAGLVKGDGSVSPLAHWAVGAGTWDETISPPADSVRATWTTLAKEIKRKPILPGQITFVPAGAPSRTLEIQMSFTIQDFGGQPVVLREFGLLSGGTPAQAKLINHRVHAPIGIESGFTLQRTLRLTF